MSKDKEKQEFRVKWSFDVTSPEGKLFDYLNSLGNLRQSEVVRVLMTHFYPEVAFINDELDRIDLRKALTLIIQLEQRAAYLRSLLGLPVDMDIRSARGTTRAEYASLPSPEPFKTASESAVPVPPVSPFKMGLDNSGNLHLKSAFSEGVEADDSQVVPMPSDTGISLDINTMNEDWDEEDEEDEDYDDLPNPYDDGI